MQNFLKLKLGSPLRNVTVINIEKTKLTLPSGNTEKIVFTVHEKATGHYFRISDVWTETHKKDLKIRGLWYPNEQEALPADCALSYLMRYYKVSTLDELINKEVLVYPDPKNYLVLVACNMPINTDTN